MPEPTRERLIVEAMRLFADRGFRATRVGDIEAAAGLSPRAGAFYRHFKSKEEVLHAALDHHVAGLANLDQLTSLMPLGDVRAELTLAVRWALRFLGEQSALLRLVQRDADQFPELIARVHSALVMPGYEQATAFFARLLCDAGGDDTEARGIATIALASIVHYVEDRALYGVPPGDLDEEDFVQAWVETWARYLS